MPKVSVSSLLNDLKNAKSVTDYEAVAQGMQNLTVHEFDVLSRYVGMKGGQIQKSFDALTVGGIGRNIQQGIENAGTYLGNTNFGQMRQDLGEAITEGPIGQGAGWAQRKGTTLLNDLDAFYHNADGTYNRTKVGLTAAAGLGIAGIAGYNMNN